MTGRATLLDPAWRYVEKPEMAQFRAADWQVLEPQKRVYYQHSRADHVLRLLRTLEADPSWGYAINIFEHCLQSATMLLRDGHDEETVVVGLLHDIGFTICPETHGAFAGALLAPYVDPRHVWMLERHGIFQLHHCHEHPDADPHERERWRGHPHFEWAAEYVERYDQNAIDPAVGWAPLATFEPMVRRVFAAPRYRVTPP